MGAVWSWGVVWVGTKYLLEVGLKKNQLTAVGKNKERATHRLTYGTRRCTPSTNCTAQSIEHRTIHQNTIEHPSNIHRPTIEHSSNIHQTIH